MAYLATAPYPNWLTRTMSSTSRTACDNHARPASPQLSISTAPLLQLGLGGQQGWPGLGPNLPWFFSFRRSR
jgi:hypothetical protein